MLELSFQGQLSSERKTEPTFGFDFRLSLQHQGITAFYGQSGEGKSTLLRLISGLDKVENGQISFKGECWQDGRIFVPAEKRNIGYVFQDGRLFDALTVEANILYGLGRKQNKVSKLDRETAAWVTNVCDRLGIADWMKRYPQELSGGQQQRVAIARSLVCRPSLLLLDEPFSSLDETSKSALLISLQALTTAQKIPCVLVSHSRYEIESIAQYGVMIQAGMVVHHDTISNLLTRLDLSLSHEEHATSLLHTKVIEHDEICALSVLSLKDGQHIWVKRVPANIGDAVVLRLFARDIIVSLLKPVESSVLNLLSGEILDIEHANTSKVLLLIAIEGQKMLARITRKSLLNLDFSIGQKVYVQFKSVGVANCFVTGALESDKLNKTE